MAIYHLSMKPLCRTQGRSAVAAAAYRAAEHLTNARDGLSHDYTGRQGVVHSEIILPLGVVADWAQDRSTLWNAAEAIEKRSDARTAREFVLALPHELDDGQRLELTRGFAAHLAERYGAAVDVAIHQPHEDKDLRNRHAHLLMTTRQVTPGGLGEKTALEWKNQRLQAAGLPTSHDQLRDIRQAWEDHANLALARAGHEVRIDHRSHRERGLEIEPTQHVGVHATGVVRKGRAVERRRIAPPAAARNAARIIARPEEVLTIITDEKSVFDRRDIARALHRYIDQPAAFQTALAKVMASPALLELQAEQKAPRGQVAQPARYTTRAQFQLEHDMAERADRMAIASRQKGSWGFGQIGTEVALRHHAHLSDEQREAVRHVAGSERIAAVVGLAGAGKSTMLAAAKEAWERGDRPGRVFGAALAGKAAEGLEQSSGIPSRTLASWERSWERGFDPLRRGDVFVIDEAGMVSSAQLARFVEAVDRAGAKLVLVGDPEQLQPINAGAAFRAIAERVGFVALEGIRRQAEDWQRKASVDFGRSRVGEGLAAYADHGAVRFEPDRDQARAAIVQDVMADMTAHPESSRIVLAHRRVDVRALNDDIRNARKAQGALSEEAPFATANGERRFAAGDRMVFLENDRTLGVKNGMLGTVERAGEGVLQVRLDSEGGQRDGRQGRMVEVNQETYQAVDHGYATTIHKSQGATVDRAFVLASESMDKHLVYVGMTRHRAAATLYAGQDEFRDLDALSDRLSRSNAKETTLDYAARRGLAPPSEIVLPDAYRPAAATAERGQEAADTGHSPVDTLRAKVLAARERMEGSQALSPAAETPRDALRAQLRRLDSLDLSQAMEADRTRDRGASVSREMTVADAARLISPAYAETADRLAEVRSGVAASEKAIRTYTQQRDHALDQGDVRWKAMGTMRQYGHRTGVRPDHAMSTHERDEASAAERLGIEEKRRDERVTMLPGLERAEAEALEAVRPQAEAKLAELQEQAEVAREVQQEKWQAQKEREQTQRRERGHERDLGMER